MKKKEILRAYRVINGELIIYEVMNARRGSNCVYRLRRLDDPSRGWFGAQHHNTYFKVSDAKKAAIASTKASLKQSKNWVKREEKELKKILKIKTKAVA